MLSIFEIREVLKASTQVYLRLPPETPLASLVLLYEVCTYLALACVSACPPGKEKGTAVGFD